MVYTKNWIEKNLGITRKAIDIYEKHGFIHPAKNRNNGKYREFSEDDLMTIWHVKFFVELGFSLEEIKDMINNSDFDFHEMINEKIEKMEAEKNRLEQLIGLAKYIKVTGLVPNTPKEMGTMGIQNFLAHSRKVLNVDANMELKFFYEAIQCAISKPDGKWNEEDLDTFTEQVLSKFDNGWNEEDLLQLFNQILSNPETEWSKEFISPLIEIFTKTNLESLSILYSNLQELAVLHPNEVSHPEVQSIIKKIYNFYQSSLLSEYSDKIIPKWNVQNISNFLFSSDIIALMEKIYGKEWCEFYFKAMEYFCEHSM